MPPEATPDIVVTAFDHYRLFRLLDRLRRAQPDAAPAHDALEHELDRAIVVEQDEVPPDVVTMNSMVRAVDQNTEEELKITVVFPGQAAPRDGKISVLAPLGLALFGARVGDEIEWPMPGGTRRLYVDRLLFQPEAAGRFDL